LQWRRGQSGDRIECDGRRVLPAPRCDAAGARSSSQPRRFGSRLGVDLARGHLARERGAGHRVDGDVAGSGGYYVAAAADKIVAEPATLTGSIGVLAGNWSLLTSQENRRFNRQRVIGAPAMFSRSPTSRRVRTAASRRFDETYKGLHDHAPPAAR
jgi:hypothetical protein